MIGHGSRDDAGAREFRTFATEVGRRLGSPDLVTACFLELSAPSVLDALASLVQQGATRVVATPIFLFSAGHIKNDIPSAINEARRRFPDVRVDYGIPFGIEPECLDALDSRICELEGALPPFPRDRTAVLLVERGSSDPDANARVYHLARLLWEGRAFGWVETCFIGITGPTLEEGLRRCEALGAERILVAPYFLFTGVLVQRIRSSVVAFAKRPGASNIALAEHLSCHPRMVDLAVRRIAEVGELRMRMTRDFCKYRVPLVGFEHQVGAPHHSDHKHGFR